MPMSFDCQYTHIHRQAHIYIILEESILFYIYIYIYIGICVYIRYIYVLLYKYIHRYICIYKVYKPYIVNLMTKFTLLV